MSESVHFIGVDVGTGSARAGLFDRRGRLIGRGEREIRMWEPRVDFAEQSSEDIWTAVSSAVRTAIDRSTVDPGSIAGIGFDATCSLVVLDAEDRPVTVSPSGADRRNIIVWMDHRAIEEAREIDRTDHRVLRHVGGSVSPEMQSPKLLWLKRNLPETWERAAGFFDLADFLTYRATGDPTRSLCTTVCKWTYMGHEADDLDETGWIDDYWRAIGLADLVDEGFSRIGRRIRPLGAPVGEGLTEPAARDLGLRTDTSVSVSAIDAHAGGIGILGSPEGPADGEAGVQAASGLEQRLALIGGTSSCHMAVSTEPRFIDGVWGPYYSAMIPEMWLTEGGQSATGALIDHVIFSHARSTELEERAEDADRTVYELLNARVDRLSENEPFRARLTRDLHVLPYFHGNRSPRSDPSLTGMISGLRLSDSIDELARLYLATIQAVAHGTRHIVDTLNEAGYRIETIVATGGGTKNPLFLREHADVTGCRIVLPSEREAVLLGSAMLGAVASGERESVLEAASAMSGVGRVIEPTGGDVKRYHDAKHAVFHRMYEHQMEYRARMNE